MVNLRCDICNAKLTNKNIGYIKIGKERILKCKKCHTSLKSAKRKEKKIFF